MDYNQMPVPHHTGNSLVEYILPTALILGLMVVSCSLLPDTLVQQVLKTVKGQQTGDKLQITSMGKPDFTPLSSTLGPPKPDEEQVCYYSTGLCLNIPLVQAGPFSETVGGLGGDLVKRYADVLQQLVEQLQASQADPNLINLISKLANKGHGLGDDMNTLETSCIPGTLTTGERVCMTTTQEHGIQYAKKIENFNTNYLQVLQYLDQDPSYLNTQIRSIISLEGSEIQKLANQFKTEPYAFNGIQVIKDSGGTASGFTVINAEPVQETVLVHQSANNICETSTDPSCFRAHPSQTSAAATTSKSPIPSP